MYNRTVQSEPYFDASALLPSGPGRFLSSEYFRLPDEPRCELLRGYLVLTPAPSFRHQLACALLADLLLRYARRIGGRSVQSPVDVELGERTVVQPDVVLVTPSRLDRIQHHLVGAPDLAVEVLSPGTAGRDRNEKLALYAASDLRELWLVDPGARTFEALTRNDASFTVALPTGGHYASPLFPALEVDLAAFWNELDAPPAV